MRIRYLIIVLFVFLCGCQSLRHLITPDAVKQTAELNYQNAEKVNYKGTKAGSIESKRLVKGSRTMLAFTGISAQQPNMKDFDKIISRAEKAIAGFDIMQLVGVSGGGIISLILAYLGFGWLKGGKIASTLIKGIQAIKGAIPVKYRGVVNSVIKNQAIQDGINKKLTKTVKKVKGK